MKNHLHIFLVFCISFFVVTAYNLRVFPVSAFSQSNPQVSVFVRDDCAHCQKEKQFLTELTSIDTSIQVHYYNLRNADDYAMFLAVTKEFNLIKGTPVTLVGNKIFQGFDRAETTGDTIIQSIKYAQKFFTFNEALHNPSHVTVISSLMSTNTCTPESHVQCAVPELSVHIPVADRTINVMQYSLFGMASILGLIDGFNPCALWVLVMFITLLSQVGSVRRMAQYAGIFIFAEAIMYYVILMIWFSAWDFIGLSRIVTPVIGLLAIGSGIYFFYKYFTWQPVCSVTNAQQQNEISHKITQLAHQPLTITVVIGILMLAFSVNIFEFACSIGIPQTFTKILEMNHLNFWQTQWYMVVYIVMYMVDDIIVLYLAIKGAQKISGIMNYSRIATLIGGILMLILGIVMLFAPELLII